MCYAYEPRLPALTTMPEVSSVRPLPTGPQYFTFDPLPEVETRSAACKTLSKASRLKKRSRRVLYPPVVKRYYPAEERSFAKRLLFILLAVVFFQVYSAEEELTLMAASPDIEKGSLGCSLAEAQESRCEPPFMEQPIDSAFSLEIVEVANASSWIWEGEEVSEAAIDITHVLEQSPASF